MKTTRRVLLARLAAIAVAAASGCSAGDAVPAGDERPSVGTAASADVSGKRVTVAPKVYGDSHVIVHNWGAFDMNFWAVCQNSDV